MEYNGERLYRGLNLMYLGQLVGMIGIFGGILLILIPGLAILGLLAVLVGAVGAIVSIVGQFKLRNEHGDYMTALILLVATFILNLASKNTGGMVSSLTDLAGSVCSLAGNYFVIRGTNSFLIQRDREDLAEKGKRAWRINLACSVAAVVLGEAADWFGESLGVLVVLLIMVSVLGVISVVFMLNYLKDSANALH